MAMTVPDATVRRARDHPRNQRSTRHPRADQRRIRRLSERRSTVTRALSGPEWGGLPIPSVLSRLPGCLVEERQIGHRDEVAGDGVLHEPCPTTGRDPAGTAAETRDAELVEL